MTTISEMMADAHAIAKRINGTVGGLPSMIDARANRDGREPSAAVSARRERVADLYESGATPDEIAEAVGIPRNNVYNDLHTLRKRGIIDNG